MYSISSLLNSIILVEVLTCIGNRFQSLMTLGTKEKNKYWVRANRTQKLLLSSCLSCLVD